MTTEKNNTGMRVLTILLAVLLVVAGIMVVKLYNQEKETKAQLEKEKEIVLKDLNEMVVQYDEVIEEKGLKSFANIQLKPQMKSQHGEWTAAEIFTTNNELGDFSIISWNILGISMLAFIRGNLG